MDARASARYYEEQEAWIKYERAIEAAKLDMVKAIQEAGVEYTNKMRELELDYAKPPAPLKQNEDGSYDLPF